MIINGKDGVDHINIYSKGETEIGRFLSNFAYAPIRVPGHGYFKTIEGYWHWLATDDDRFRRLDGNSAKELGKKLEKMYRDDFEDRIKDAIDIKLKTHVDFLHYLAKTTLPLCHYYNFNGFKKDAGHDWLVKHIEDRRERMKKYLSDKRHCIVAGSRNFDTSEEYNFMKRELMDYLKKFEYETNLEKKLIIVEGGAKGADKFARKFAKETKLDYVTFHAYWDTHGKSAGALRNKRMARYSDVCFIFNKGTKGSNMMYDIAKSYELEIHHYDMNNYYVYSGNGSYLFFRGVDVD